MLGWMLLPGRLALRALDDVHAIAGAAAALPGEVTRIRVAIEKLPPRVEGLRDAFEGSNDELRALRRDVGGRVGEVADELDDVRDVVEPLEPAAERIGKLAEWLPGGGRSHQED
jgi:hypothetical protein